MNQKVGGVLAEIKRLQTQSAFGRVESLAGTLLVVKAPSNRVFIGEICVIEGREGRRIQAEVVGFREESALVMPYDAIEGVGPGSKIEFAGQEAVAYPHQSWLGRVLNGLGEPIDGQEPLLYGDRVYSYKAPPIPAHARALVEERLDLGVRAFNTFLTCCRGQRMGVFAGSGVGKSMLLAQLARNAKADVIVIGLIGERGREVKEFIKHTLGEEGLKKSVLIVSTSDEPALLRRQAAYLTMTVSEYFRDQGCEVLCLMDSVTRFAMALREIGLALGEPSASKGYTPSVFAELPRLLERAGPGLDKAQSGSITGLFTVLVEGDDHNEPVADSVRSILDGHVVLERAIAERGRYPAINLLRSVSRSMPMCNTEDETRLIKKARQLLSTYEDMAEMIRLGAYRRGTNAEVDEAIQYNAPLEEFLSQKLNECVSLPDAFQLLEEILPPVKDI